jgi:hypothetical protein
MILKITSTHTCLTGLQTPSPGQSTEQMSTRQRTSFRLVDHINIHRRLLGCISVCGLVAIKTIILRQPTGQVDIQTSVSPPSVPMSSPSRSQRRILVPAGNTQTPSMAPTRPWYVRIRLLLCLAPTPSRLGTMVRQSQRACQSLWMLSRLQIQASIGIY